ncbi:hypothetical protein [Pseudonocardia alni]|uniref:hypothetical protein n=1 Tax=Pseudonocardia alni TaxID=33907 RepID=UPI003333ABDF
MCRRATCRNCGKVTWQGCGQHVDQVMAGVRSAERCRCTPAERSGGGLFARLFGRS